MLQKSKRKSVMNQLPRKRGRPRKIPHCLTKSFKNE